MAKEIDPRDYLAEFLAAGGTVQQIPVGQKTDPAVIVHSYGGRPKKKVEVVVVKEAKPKKERKVKK
jgi:hypothetical protein